MRAVLVIIYVLIAALSAEAKPIVLATFDIPLMVVSEDEGLFVKLTRTIAKKENLDIKIVVYPTSKARLAFSNKQVDGFFPAVDLYMPQKYSKSDSFYQKVSYVFYRTENPLKTIKDLEGKRVGLTFRFNYGAELVSNKKIKFEFAADDVTNMKKLDDGSVDAFVIEERSGLKALQLIGSKNITFDKSAPVSAREVYYAFQGNAEGKKLAKIFSQAIQEMRRDGSLEKLFSE